MRIFDNLRSRLVTSETSENKVPKLPRELSHQSGMVELVEYSTKKGKSRNWAKNCGNPELVSKDGNKSCWCWYCKQDFFRERYVDQES